MKKTLLSDIVSFLFILLFVYAASSKLLDFQKFQVQLGKSPLLAMFSGWIVWAVPALEIIIAFGLFFKRSQLIALYLSFSLMCLFSSYIVAILNFSEYIPCSCGGILEGMGWKQHLWFNILFVILGAAAVLFYPNKHKEIIAR